MIDLFELYFILLGVVQCLRNNGEYNADHYAYKLSLTADTWRNGRAYCRSIGGEMAVHGMKSLASR